MISVALIVLAIGALVFAAHFFGWLFSFTAVPDVLLLMLVGLLLGYWVQPDFFGQFGDVVLTITLVVMLFESGTKLQASVLRSAFTGTTRLVLASFILSMVAVAVVAWLVIGLSFIVALILGAIVGGTSSAVVIPLLDRLQVASTSRALLILESAFSDVLAIVITIGLLSAVTTGSVSLAGVALQTVISFVYAALFGLVSGFIWSLLLDQVRHINNSMFVTLAFVFILYGLVEAIGFSGPIAALVFGIVLGNSGPLKQRLSAAHPLLRWLINPVVLSRRERAFFSEIVFLLQTFFFIFVGLSIRITNVRAMITALGISAALLVVRYLAVRVTLPRSTDVWEASYAAIMIPRGLAAAVLAALVAQQGIPQAGTIQEITYGVVLWSIVLTSIFVFLLSKTSLKVTYARLLRGFGAPQSPPPAYDN